MTLARTISLLVATALAALAPAGARAEDPFLRRTTTVRVVERVGPAVVNVTTEQQDQRRPFAPFGGDPLFDRFFQDLFEPRVPQRTQSLGSGVVIDAHGHVLTNEHVIARAEAIHVTLADGRALEATLVGADPNNDLAVLEIQSKQAVPWIPPGESADLMVGEPVIAIGNPFGLSNSVTTGVVSALDRSIRTGNRVFHGFLQTDASINPGNSGGPLLNAAGELIGVNTAIYDGAQGIGFAIPIDVARRVVQVLITRGSVPPVWIGADLQDLDSQLGDLMALPEGASGALVSRVRNPGPAHSAGVARGDVLTKLDGHPIRSTAELYDELSRTTPGQKLDAELLRQGTALHVTLRAEELPAAELDALPLQLLGMELAIQPGGGALVSRVAPSGGAARIGIQAGDLIVGVNGRALTDAGALRSAVVELRGRDRALVVVRRGRGQYHVAIPIS